MLYQTVKLDCGHEITWGEPVGMPGASLPHVGDWAWCPKCEVDAEIIEVTPDYDTQHGYLVLFDPKDELKTDETGEFTAESLKPLYEAIDAQGFAIDERDLLIGQYNNQVGGYVTVFERDSDFICEKCGGPSFGWGYSFCPKCHVDALNAVLKYQGSNMFFDWRYRI